MSFCNDHKKAKYKICQPSIIHPWYTQQRRNFSRILPTFTRAQIKCLPVRSALYATTFAWKPKIAPAVIRLSAGDVKIQRGKRPHAKNATQNWASSPHSIQWYNLCSNGPLLHVYSNVAWPKFQFNLTVSMFCPNVTNAPSPVLILANRCLSEQAKSKVTKRPVY